MEMVMNIKNLSIIGTSFFMAAIMSNVYAGINYDCLGPTEPVGGNWANIEYGVNVISDSMLFEPEGVIQGKGSQCGKKVFIGCHQNSGDEGLPFCQGVDTQVSADATCKKGEDSGHFHLTFDNYTISKDQTSRITTYTIDVNYTQGDRKGKWQYSWLNKNHKIIQKFKEGSFLTATCPTLTANLLR